MTGWRAKVRALLDDDAGPRADLPASAKTAIVAKTPPEAWSGPSFGSFGSFGGGLEGRAATLAERAAIVQEGAAVPAEWAEGFARLNVAWLAMMDAAGRFLDQWGSKAAALGWTASELFGLDDSPIGREDRMGAAFFLADAEVIAVTAETITVRKGGNVARLRRRDGFTIPAWEVIG